MSFKFYKQPDSMDCGLWRDYRQSHHYVRQTICGDSRNMFCRGSAYCLVYHFTLVRAVRQQNHHAVMGLSCRAFAYNDNHSSDSVVTLLESSERKPSGGVVINEE